ncbi:ComF family protein [Patescibacteria group bacterium]|nr:ComF family protein [Patescibacteria group bacterium]MBU1890531.1 ComF family protein [Patescibacteria group bacterium]
MTKFIANATRLIKDIVFPVQCLGNCGTYDTWLCPACSNQIFNELDPECPHCRRKQQSNKTCSKCQTQTALDGLIILTDYQSPLIQKLIQSFKYKYVEDIGKLFGQRLAQKLCSCLNTHGLIKNNTIITTVPLHWKRKNERGYNQSEIIANSLTDTLDVGVNHDTLTRPVYTSSQAKLKRHERLKNLNNSFQLKTGVVLSGQNVIIIDDVATTTATLGECAKILKRAGANSVWGAVIARSNL